jgi:cyclophilin family peptidyl-prolyl cis-trans isomerase
MQTAAVKRVVKEIRLPELNHDKAGMVNMANGGPHTNGGEWCIMLGDRSYLDGVS